MNMFSQFRIVVFLAVALAAVALMIPGPASAQRAGPEPPAKAAHLPAPEPSLPRLRVAGAELPVRLVSLAIRTSIQSGFAESTLDMEFHNPNRRILEGELEFPLSPGQEISGLALDINGELRRGVPVSKARGQEVFDDIARQKVDPALLEATRGNAYRLRVYPLPAGGQRRVVVRIMQPLKVEGGQMHYRLPLSLAETLDSVSIEAEVVSPGGAVKAEAGNLGLRLEKTGATYKGRVERSNISPEGWLDISLPTSGSLSDALTAVRWGDKLYFSAATEVAVPDQARKLPDRVTILWDASGSGLKRNQAQEFALLDSYFQALDSGQARLIVLRDKAEPPQNFDIKKGDWTGLREAVHGLVYDGATNLADWQPTADCQEYLLFSDGLDNYRGTGEKKIPRVAPEQRLFAINSAPTADYAALRALVPGGALIDLAQETTQLAEAKLLRAGARVSIINSALAGAAEAALGPESAYLGSAEGQGGLIRLAGWAKRGGGVKEVPVQIVGPDGSSTRLNIALPAWDKTPEATGEEAPLQARLWGRYAISGLEGDYKTNKRAIARLGEDLGIVSRETSLIVLETAADYARYGVKPPASLQAQVDALRLNKTAAGGEKNLPDEKLLSMWREKVSWWERDFDPKPQPKAQDTKLETPATDPSRAEGRGSSEVRGDRFSSGEVQGASLMRSTYFDQAYMMPSSGAHAEPAKGSVRAATRVGLILKPWVSNAPYIARMLTAKDDELYAIYLDERPDYQNSSAFFIDVADRFFERGLKELGLRVLSNLAEMQLENRQVLRLLAYRLIEAGEMAAALPVLEQVRELAPYEPQSLRDIALVKAALGQTQEAVDLLYETARRQWSNRFSDINNIALTEMNALIASDREKVKTEAIDSRLIRNLASDLRVVLSWDMDNTDMDLWVTSPDGEVAKYNHRLTRMGGHMSRDCTQGYGPEEFMLKKAVPGLYRVEVDYFGHSRQTIAGEVSMMVTVFSKFGTPEQKEQTSTLRLKNTKERVSVAEFYVEE